MPDTASFCSPNPGLVWASRSGSAWERLEDRSGQPGPAKDGYHGLGGVSFTGTPGAVSKLHLETPHQKVEVEYLKQPGGGTFTIAAGTVTAGETVLGEVATDGDKEPGFADFTVPEGATDFSIAVKSGSVRLFGASFEKDSPGVIYNSLGVNGGQVQMVLRYYEKTQWTEQLQHQKPDLVILNYGTNESGFASYIETSYGKELREVIARVKAALPGTPVLIMSPMDRGDRRSDGTIGTIATLPSWWRFSARRRLRRAARSSTRSKPWAAKEPWADGMPCNRVW